MSRERALTVPTPVAAVLTAQDVAALNEANIVTFLFDAAAGTAVARAAMQWPITPELQALFPEDGQNHEQCARSIACGVEITGYGPRGRFDGDWCELDAVSTMCRVRVSRGDPFWSTVLRLVKPGDRLRQKWFAGTGGPVLNSAGLIKDEFAVEIQRDDEPALRFYLRHHVTVSDDVHRMVVRGVMNDGHMAPSAPVAQIQT